jgi:hypothetical protein
VGCIGIEEVIVTEPARTFAVASDDALVDLITRARIRLVVIAPALTKAVAEAISDRFNDLGRLDTTVILDSDPEVYRLGFGDADALETIRKASANTPFDLREQPGVRIGVVISDDTTMVYSPVSKNIEAGSSSVEKPNAIVLGGRAAADIASAAGADAGGVVRKPEVGTEALDPTKVEQMQSNLKANPPKPFDITRKLNVFTSKVQYVEFSASNYRLTTRQIPLPPELVDVTNEDLRKRITGRIRAPLDGVGKLKISIEQDGKSEAIEVDDGWLNKERKRIEDEYTFLIKKFGRVILYKDRPKFIEATNRFKLIIEKYQEALRATLTKSKAEFEERVVDEFLSRWQQSPPEYFRRWEIVPTHEKIRSVLQGFANDIFEKAVSFDEPKVDVNYKNVAPENLRDSSFLDELKKIMHKRRVPREIIDSLFEEGQAAPETGAFLGSQG